MVLLTVGSGEIAVRDLLVEGRRVVADGALTGLDLPATLAVGRKRVARLSA